MNADLLIEQRTEARARGDYPEADRIRLHLATLGVPVVDHGMRTIRADELDRERIKAARQARVLVSWCGLLG